MGHRSQGNRNAKMIVVDPRFTRTASVADLFCQLRVGGDIAFLGGLINYAIENNRIAKDYLLHYTNAAFIVKDVFKLPENEECSPALTPKRRPTRNRAGITRAAMHKANPFPNRTSWPLRRIREWRSATAAGLARNSGLRLFTAASQLRVPTPQETLQPLPRRKWWSASLACLKISSIKPPTSSPPSAKMAT